MIKLKVMKLDYTGAPQEGGDAYEGENYTELVQALNARRLDPCACIKEYVEKACDLLKRQGGYEIGVTGATDEDLAAAFVGALIRAGLAALL